MTISLGTLSNTPAVRGGGLSDTRYSLNLTSESNLNVALTDVSPNQNFKLRVFRDANNDGQLTGSETTAVLRSSGGANTSDVGIFGAKLKAGHYFADVSRISGIGTNASYNIRASATGTERSNVIASTAELVSRNSTFKDFFTISDTQTSNFYRMDFVHGSIGKSPIKVTVQGNVGARIIKDANFDHQVTFNEVLGTFSGTKTRSFTISPQGNNSDNFYVQTFQLTPGTTVPNTVTFQ